MGIDAADWVISVLFICLVGGHVKLNFLLSLFFFFLFEWGI